MARPVGRYFASVVSQLRKLKNDEVITIDPSFKSKLRAQMVAHIHGTTPTVSNAVPRQWRILQYLKYYMVPFAAAGYVALAAVVISVHPVPFHKVTTLVADSNIHQPTTLLQNTQIIAQEDAFVGTPVQTFPARLVLPPAMLAKIYHEDQTIAAKVVPQNTSSTKVPPKNTHDTVSPVAAVTPPPSQARTQAIASVDQTPADLNSSSSATQPSAAALVIPAKLDIRYASYIHFSEARKAPLEKAVYENAVNLEVNYVMVEYKNGSLIFEFHLKDGTVKQINYIETYVPTRTNP